ncbi:oligomeric golgi complex component, COG2-domain-containing protein [Peziza echinospora]|nr:oligomeric golgi complex component, COG2-domain-containing protein [Peziza echinospora]
MSRFILPSSSATTPRHSRPPSPRAGGQQDYFTINTNTSAYNNNAYDSNDDSDDPTTLPFPQPLSRSQFTTPEFTPTAFLSTLHNRHQTLEDLRLELRNRSRDLDRELLDLVNRDYSDFVGLGRSLGGGEGRVEDLRVGLLQFRREVEGITSKLEATKKDTESLIGERRRISREKDVVRGLLEVARRVEEVEMLLDIDGIGGGSSGGGNNNTLLLLYQAMEEDGDNEDAGGPGISGMSLSRLKTITTAYLCLKHIHEKVGTITGPAHPFLKSQRPRIERIRKTVVLDLGTALREVVARGGEPAVVVIEGEEERRKRRVMGIMGLFVEIGEEAEAVRILKEAASGSKVGAASISTPSSRKTQLPVGKPPVVSSRMKMVYSNN